MRERINSDGLFLSKGNDFNNRLSKFSPNVFKLFPFNFHQTLTEGRSLVREVVRETDLKRETYNRNIITECFLTSTELRSRIHSYSAQILSSEY